MNRQRTGLWARIRRIWAIVGSVLLLAWILWCAIAFRPNADARAAMASGDGVSVQQVDGAWLFKPTTDTGIDQGSLLFFPGGLVDPAAYAPLLREVAARGHRALLLPVPRRGAFGGAEDPRVLSGARALTTRLGGRWVVAGHSKGGKIATLYAHAYPDDVAGLVLVGTSHPRDVDLSGARYPVVQLLGDRDRIASIERADGNRHKLPADTSRIVVEGGNHSQFGDYGFQPGDRTARIDRDHQRATTATALLSVLQATPQAPPKDTTP